MIVRGLIGEAGDPIAALATLRALRDEMLARAEKS
jgi:hypothetical protein